MIMVKQMGPMLKVNGQLEGNELPGTFEFENVDISNATINPEQAMATVRNWPYVQDLSEYAFRQQWKSLVQQAANIVLDSIR